MPELPEVETVARLIRPGAVGRTITGTTVGWVRTLGGTTGRGFSDAVVGARIDEVRRRAKFIVMDLTRGGSPAGALTIHLRMSGRLHVESAGTPASPYARVQLALDNGTRLDFVDVRKFGRFEYHADPTDRLADLGPEPLEDAFTAAWFRDALRSRKRMLKPLLLDQTFLAGLGNIYVDEALHAARLHPMTQASRV